MVKYITSMDEFNAMLETSKSKLVVIDFTATWCGYVFAFSDMTFVGLS